MRGAQYLVFACGCVMTSRRSRVGSAAQALRKQAGELRRGERGQTGERLQVGAARDRQAFSWARPPAWQRFET